MNSYGVVGQNIVSPRHFFAIPIKQDLCYLKPLHWMNLLQEFGQNT